MSQRRKQQVLILSMTLLTTALFTLFIHISQAERAFPQDAALRASQIETAKGLFTVGVSFALLLFSLVLWIGKRSETYLFWLALLSYTTMVRTLMNTLPFLGELPLLNLLFLGRFSYFGASFPRMNQNIHRLVMCLVVAFLRYRLMKCLFDIKIGRRHYFFYLCLAALAPICCLDTGLSFYLALMFVYIVCYLCEAWVILRSVSESPGTAVILAAAWSFTVSLRFFDAGCELSLFPLEFPDLQLRLRGIIESFYGLAFFLLACLRFARKFKEAERLNAHLEEQIRQKTKEKTEFVRSLLHNLKTPLFSLGGYVDMARAYLDSEPPKTLECLDKLSQNTQYVQELMERIFLVSQLDDGKIAFQQLPFDLKKLLEEVAEQTRLRAGQKPIEVRLCVPGPLPCRADPVYCRQALQNIADNAVEQMPGPGHILITGQENADYCLIGIRDDGIGIAPQNQQRIFERYYSEHHGKRNSSGLGLAISRELIERQGGRITVESQPDIGTVFWVRIPQTKEET
ncbi:MAG: HAMP domain-containing histidine kinase [Lachnospiraceae bacterium]|nr:HAMP domain-containing histidine kinase [Lachnospiraceae bacterium]